ncbi:glycosyltransferase, partial [bacterium]|nr:glycosyltransferase [bacterium]
EIIENIPSLKDKIHTIINGVDTKSFYKKSQNKDKKKEEIVIGTIGRLTPEKDYGTLLEAFENVQRELPNIKLKIVGSGNLEYELKGLALKLQINEKVEFLGQRNDIPKILQTFDIFILSSIQEGCSNVILEAFATGLPVIATNVGDNHILLADNRGLLVEPNSQALANSIKTLISDKEKSSKYANAAYDWVTKKRTMKNMVTDYEDIYTKLYFQKMK